MAVMSTAEALPGFTSSASDGEDGEYWSLRKCIRAYTDYAGSKREEILEQQNAMCYRHGAQWTVSQVEVFNKRRQPVVTYNRIGRKIDGIVGLMEKLKQDPKAFPRNPRQTDEAGAELATAVVRSIVEGQLREAVFPYGIESGATAGIGGVEMMVVKGDRGDPDVGFAHVRPDTFFYDKTSVEPDFSDARYMGIAKWLDIEDIVALAPEKAQEIRDQTSASGSELIANDLQSRARNWFENSKDFKRGRVCEIWYKHKGTWCYAIFTGAMILREDKGYFFDEKGEAICKFIMFSAFVDHDGDRYGFVRNLRSSQDEINQRRSKGLHELNSRRIKAEDGAFADVELTRREAVRPDGVVIYNKGFEMEFDDQARIANVEGQLKFLEDAKAEIENFGPNPALIGQGLEYKSGRAINLLQQAGIAELGPFVIGVRNWKLRIYRASWSGAQKYWTAERWIRVTDVEGVPQAIQLNGVGIDPATGLPRMINALGQLDVNFTLDEGPDEINMMGDAYDTLVALAGQGANIPPQVLLELAPLANSIKKKLLAILEKPDPMAEQAKQVALAAEGAKVGETQSKTDLNRAKAQEIAQGGAHGIVERQLDAAQSEREHAMKMQGEAVKVRAADQTAQIKLREQFANLQSNKQKVQDELMRDRLRAAFDIQHKQKLNEVAIAAARAKAAAAAKGAKPRA